MADNREKNDGNQESDQQQQQQQPGQTRESGWKTVSKYMLEHKVDTALWITRALTLWFCVSYFLPFFSAPEASYQKVLMSNAATSALRLHQRSHTVTLSRAFLMQLAAEDSAHYLLFSLNFLSCSPVTLVLLPVLLFALLHFASYTVVLFDVAGENNALAPRWLISLVEYHHRNILSGAAFVEIFLMPLTIINLFFGRINLVTPIIYYQFLLLRYQSRRNPNTRIMFRELRVSAEQVANKPIVPAFLRNAAHRCISLISRLAPAVPTQ